MQEAREQKGWHKLHKLRRLYHARTQGARKRCYSVPMKSTPPAEQAALKVIGEGREWGAIAAQGSQKQTAKEYHDERSAVPT